MDFRHKLNDMLEHRTKSRAGRIYYSVLMVMTILSILPLAFKEDPIPLVIQDQIAVLFFIADYILRWCTADLHSSSKSRHPFLLFPFTPGAIIDLLSILPSLAQVHSIFAVLRLVRLARIMHILRVFRSYRYTPYLRMLVNVIRRTRPALAATNIFAASYVLISALIIFNVEPDTFRTFFDALYWAIVSLTTLGYGDIYPVTTIGRIVTIISSIMGIGIIALPSAIITAGFMSELSIAKDK